MATQAAEVTSAVSEANWGPALAALCVSLFALLLLYAGTVGSLVDIWWRSETFAHGFLILPISLYLIWSRRAQIRPIQPVANLWAVPLVGAGALAWAVAARIDVLLVQQLALVAVAIAIVWGSLGTAVVRKLSFPLGYLFFAVPMGDGLVPPLQDFTARFSVSVLQWLHIPVLLEGRYISVPTGTFEVAQACAGLRYLIASVVLGTVYAYLVYRGIWRRLLFIAFAVIVPIIANGIRAAGIVALAYASDMRIATGVDHIIYGWIFFGLVMFLLFWAGQFIRETGEKPNLAGRETAPTGRVGIHGRGWYAAAGSVLLVGATAAGPGALRWMDLRAGQTTEPAALVAPQARAPWHGPFPAEDNWHPVFRGSSGTFLRGYSLGDQKVYLYSAYYFRERQGSELIKWGNRLYDDRYWARVSAGSREISAGGRHMRVVETLLRSGVTDRLLWSWYRIGGRITTNPAQAKLLEAWEDLRHGGGVAAVVAIATDYETRPAEARALLQRFLHDMGPVGPVPGPARKRRAAGVETAPPQ